MSDASKPLAGLAIYTMFRGAAMQLVQWCNFHLNAGADKLYVALDAPDEELVSWLPTSSRIHWEVIDEPAWSTHYPADSRNVERKQVDGFRWMARMAAREGHTYLAFVDADELIALSEPFVDMAARFSDTLALILPVREMWYSVGDDTDEPFAATLAVPKSSARRVNWSRAFGWRAQFLRNGLLGHDAGKTIYRLPLNAGSISVHRPVSGTLVARSAQVPNSSGQLLHYDCGSVATWNAKWSSRLTGGTVATGLGPQRRAQQRLFAHALRQPPGDQEAFFREFYSLDSDARTILDHGGLLERIDLRGMLSGPLPSDRVPNQSADANLARLPALDERVDFQFALVCDQRFVKPTFATMASVLLQIGHKGSVRFVILGDGLTPADGARLRSLEHTPFDVRVLVHDITTDLDQDVGLDDPKRATFGRVYLIDYLPPQRTVYLDGDVLATRDFSELFDLDLDTACLAGVPDSAALRLLADPTRLPIQQRNRLMGLTGGHPVEYLNGGVLIFDLDNPDFRALALAARALVVAYGRTLKQRDQDALNIAFTGRKYRLDSKYNYMTQFYVSDRCIDGDLVQLKYDAADASLIHFSGKVKPWESPEEEFYNGLYRRLVSNAEERLDVSCDFYFSRRTSPARRDWTAEQWTEALAARPTRPRAPELSADIALLDLCDDGAYLSLSTAMYEHALRAGLEMAGHAHGQQLFSLPLAHTGSCRMDLSSRVAHGVRKLSFDLSAAVAPVGGFAQGLEVVVTSPRSRGQGGFYRSLGVVDVVAAGDSATPDLLELLGVDGALEAVTDGWLTGWYRTKTRDSDETISLYVDSELVALRPAEVRRKDLAADGRTRGFRFNVANLLRLGYGNGPNLISVRVSGTNVPLRGSPVSVPGHDLRYDPGLGTWVKVARPREKPFRRVRRRLQKRS